MRSSVLAWGAGCVALALVPSLGCSLVESTSGLSGRQADASSSGGTDGGGGNPLDVADEAATDSRYEAGVSDAPAFDAPSSDGVAAEAGADGPSVDGIADSAADVADERVVAPIAFVQVAVSTPAGTSAFVHAAFQQAQVAGDLIVVAVGWNDTTSTVSTITDSAGDSYSLAVGPTSFPPDLTQSIYYARNVAAAAAGANTVTVAFVQPANVVDLRIVEYSGLDTTAPLDAVGSAMGNSAGPASAAVTTTTARELVFAAGMSTDLYSGPGTSFDARDLTTDGDMVEDRIVSTAGGYTALGPLAASCEWVLQVATFR